MYSVSLLKQYEEDSAITYRIWTAWIYPELHEDNPRINIILDNGGYATCLVEDWHRNMTYDYTRPGDWDPKETCPDHIYDSLPEEWK